MPRALVITAAGINCDLELGHAFALAGCEVEPVHLNRLMRDPGMIDRFDLIGIPGGFSFGDAVAAGRIASQLIRKFLYRPLVEAIERRVPIFAPCNGFQIAAQAGLLPGPAPGSAWPDEPPVPTVALAQNEQGRFVDRWTRMEIPRDGSSRCIWTLSLTGDEATLRLPSAHGEGRFVVGAPAIIDDLESRGQIAIRYHSDDNFNGSMARIAGICDASGVVFGLMPHPERFTRWTQHPFWTRLDASQKTGDPLGLQMFRNAVAFVRREMPEVVSEPAQAVEHADSRR